MTAIKILGSEMLRRRLVLYSCMSIAAFGVDDCAAGVDVSVLSSCEQTMAGRPGVRVETSVFVNQAAFLVQSFIVRDRYRSGPTDDCVAETRLDFVNEPAGPERGTTLNAAQLPAPDVRKLLSDFGEFWNGGADVWQAANRLIQCPPAQCGAIDPALGTTVISLVEGPVPPFIVIQTDVDAAKRVSGRIAIPFLVAEVGQDDWLEISNRGRVFWKWPLKDLTAGQLYFAMVPDDALTPLAGVWGVYVNSDGARDSTVYMPVLTHLAARPPPRSMPGF